MGKVPPRRKQLEKILRLASLALLVLPAASFSLLHCGGAQALGAPAFSILVVLEKSPDGTRMTTLGDVPRSGRGLPRRQCADFINRSSIRCIDPRIF